MKEHEWAQNLGLKDLTKDEYWQQLWPYASLVSLVALQGYFFPHYFLFPFVHTRPSSCRLLDTAWREGPAVRQGNRTFASGIL